MNISQIKKNTEDFVVVANEKGLITFVHNGLEKVLGWKEKDLLGRPLITIIPPIYHDAHNLGISRFMATEKPTLIGNPLKLKVLTKSGQEINATHIILAEKDDEEWNFGAIITLRKDG